MIWIIFQVVSLLQLIEIYYFHCSYVSRRLLTLSVFRTLSALSTFPDRTSSFRMQIVFVSSDVKLKQLSEKITSSSISNHTNGAKQSALICISKLYSGMFDDKIDQFACTWETVFNYPDENQGYTIEQYITELRELISILK